MGRNSLVGITDAYGDRVPVEVRFSHPSMSALGPTQLSMQRVPGHSRGYSGWGVTLTTHPYLARKLKKSRAIHLLPLRAFVACYRVKFTFTFCSWVLRCGSMLFSSYTLRKTAVATVYPHVWCHVMNIRRTLCFLRHSKHTFLGQWLPTRSTRDSFWECETLTDFEIILSISVNLTWRNCDFYAQNQKPLECEDVPSYLTNFPFSLHINCYVKIFNGATPPSGAGPPRYRGLTITFRPTIFGRTSLDEC